MNYYQSGSSPPNDDESGWDLKLVPQWLSWGSPVGVAVHLDRYLQAQTSVVVDFGAIVSLISCLPLRAVRADLDSVLQGRVRTGTFVLGEDGLEGRNVHDWRWLRRD